MYNESLRYVYGLGLCLLDTTYETCVRCANSKTYGMCVFRRTTPDLYIIIGPMSIGENNTKFDDACVV